MCGIIGYIGNKDGKSIVIDGLKTLEYRGYDSWGVTTKSPSGLEMVKKTGKIGGVCHEDLGLGDSTICMGHTRWATHGGVNEENCHPHMSNDESVAVVHNGIVENYQELRSELKEKGYSFLSSTDTEVIPIYIEQMMKEGLDFDTAVKTVLKKLEGNFAVVAMHKDHNHLIGARRGSPLVVGMGASETFIASDVPAFLESTNKVVYLNDDEVVVANDDGMKVFDLGSDSEIDTFVKEVDWDLEEAKKGAYPHYMLKEINEQKHTIQKAVVQDPIKFNRIIQKIKDAKGVFFVGCGTSYHACVSASYVFSHVAKEHVNVVLASEFRNYEEFLTDKTLMIAVSQSGETADLLDAVKIAKEKGVDVISVANVMGSTLTRISDENIMMNAGPEICVLSTKSYTSQLAILLSLAYGVADRLEEGKALIESVGKEVPRLIDENLESLKGLAKELKDSRDMFLIGRDLAFPSALEGALKIKEVSYIHAEGFAGGELKHGTIALIEEGVPTLVMVTEPTKSLILSNAMEIGARGGTIIGIDEKNNELYDHFIRVPYFGNASPIAMIIPVQILSYYLALERGCDPDKPRNLAKSVTVK